MLCVFHRYIYSERGWGVDLKSLMLHACLSVRVSVFFLNYIFGQFWNLLDRVHIYILAGGGGGCFMNSRRENDDE